MKRLEGPAWTLSPQKRAIDVLVGSLLTWAGPVSGLYAAPTIWRKDHMNPLFIQTRFGNFGWQEPFRIAKWRSMPPTVPETESLRGSFDARATATGEKLRETKLDELLQAINVLRGNMAVVGPYRPLIVGGRERVVDAVGEPDRPALRTAFAVTKPGWTSGLSVRREINGVDYEPSEAGLAIIEYAHNASFKEDNEVFKQTVGLGLTRVIRMGAAARKRNHPLKIIAPHNEEVLRFDFSHDTELAARLGTLATNLTDEIA